MADVSAVPFINFGESQAHQGQEEAAASLEGQQAQAASYQNQIMAARMPFIMRAYAQMGVQSDNSGAAGSGDPSGPLGASADSVNKYGYDPAAVSKRNRSNYYVPLWTQDEEKNTQLAAMSGDPSVIQLYATQRQQRLDDMGQRAAFAASNAYDKYATGADAPNSLEALRSVDPKYYDYLTGTWAQQHKGDLDSGKADLNRMAKAYMMYQAADVHKYTGRKTDVVNDQAVDAEYKTPVAGVPRMPLSSKEQAELMEKAQTPSVEVQTGFGNTKKVTPAEAAGYKNDIRGYVRDVAGGFAPDPATIMQMLGGKGPVSQNDLASFQSDVRQKAVQHASQNGTQPPVDTRQAPVDPENPGALHDVPAAKSKPNFKQPPANQPPAGATPQNPTAGAPGAGGGVPGGAPPSGAAPGAGGAPGGSVGGQAAPVAKGAPPKGMLVNPDSLPKSQDEYAGPNATLRPRQAERQKVDEQQRGEMRKEASQNLSQDFAQQNAIAQTRTDLAKAAKDPELYGPQGKAYAEYQKLKAYFTRQPSDALVNWTEVNKMLLNMGTVNVRAALAGQKITNQEFMKLLTEGNPNSDMPLKAIQHLVNFAQAGNEYDMMLHRTQGVALGRGANPYSDEYLQLGAQRAAYVQGRMRQLEPNGGTSVTGNAAPKYSDAQITKYAKTNNIPEAEARRYLGVK